MGINVKRSTKIVSSSVVVLLGFSLPALAQDVPALMSGEWGAKACDAWNAEPILTDKLVESEWINNDADRGYKILHVYRTDCGDEPTAELRIVEKDGKAMCEYGGPIQNAELNSKVDYVMHAKTERWQEMGSGEYGPMKAMMLRRLKFSGPKWEAMKNMDPFKSFLLLAGKVSSTTESCP